MDITPYTMLALAPVGLGALLFVVSAVRVWFRYALNTKAFATHIEKLLAAGNRDRAIKLAKVAPQAPCCIVTLAALERCLSKRTLAAAQALDYSRPAGDKPFEQGAREMLETEAEAALKPVRGALVLGLFGAALALGGLAATWLLQLFPLQSIAISGGIAIFLTVLLTRSALGTMREVRQLPLRLAQHVQLED